MDKEQSFRDYLKNTNYELNMSFDQFRQSLFATHCYICGLPFDDAYFQNADDKDETYETKPEKPVRPYNWDRFKKRYRGKNRLPKDVVQQKFKEYKKTGILESITIELPAKRSPLFKKCNRRSVLDHDHLRENDNLLGVAHQHCNLQRQQRRFFIPVIFHNGSNYDFHLIIRELVRHTGA